MKQSSAPIASRRLSLALGDGDVDRAELAHAHEVAAVAVDSVVILRALLSVALEDHVVHEQLGSQSGDLLLSSHGLASGGALAEGDGVHISLSHELTHGTRQGGRLLLDDDTQITLVVLIVESGQREVEVAAALGPATEEARAFHAGEGLSTVVSGQMELGMVATAQVRLLYLANEAVCSLVQLERTASLALGVIVEGASVDINAILAAAEAHECVQPTARHLAAAALTVVTNEGHDRRILLVDLLRCSEATIAVHGAPAASDVAADVRPVRASILPRHRNIGADLELSKESKQKKLFTTGFHEGR